VLLLNHAVFSVVFVDSVGYFVDFFVTEIAVHFKHLSELAFRDLLVLEGALTLGKDFPEQLGFVGAALVVERAEEVLEVVLGQVDEAAALLEVFVTHEQVCVRHFVGLEFIVELAHLAHLVFLHVRRVVDFGSTFVFYQAHLLLDFLERLELDREELEEGADLLHEEHVHHLVLGVLVLVGVLVLAVGVHGRERLDVDHVARLGLVELGHHVVLLGVSDFLRATLGFALGFGLGVHANGGGAVVFNQFLRLGHPFLLTHGLALAFSVQVDFVAENVEG